MSRPTEAFVNGNLFELGIGYVVVARFKSEGDVEVGVFLLDVHCLGLKDAFFRRVGSCEYETSVLAKLLPADNRQPLTPSAARQLVEATVAYAQNLGFAPHPDYKKACRVFGGIPAATAATNYTFGKDGKPFYVQGPHDSAEKARRIMSLLRARCGAGNFDYLLVAGEPNTPY